MRAEDRLELAESERSEWRRLWADKARDHRAAERGLASIRVMVDAQAEDDALWGLYPIGPQSIREAHLQEELRALHALVEAVCRMVATRDML